MPLFHHHKINKKTELAIWHIVETEAFFTEKIQLKKEVAHPHKRLQHLAGRYLLQYLRPDFPMDEIAVTESRKPVLPGHSLHFSISHCGDFAAVIISEDALVGIDVEMITPKIDRLQSKFLNTHEQWMVEKESAEKLKTLTLIWSAKETLVKWYGKGKVDFKKDMEISEINWENQQLNTRFGKEINKSLNIHFHFFENLCLTYLYDLGFA